MSTEPGLRDAYDEWHAARPVDEDGDAPWHAMLKPHLHDLAGRRVLEIACGRGGFAVWLAALPIDRRPAAIVAGDFSPVAVRMAAEFGKASGAGNVSYEVADLTRLAWADGSFDVAISCETIEHLPDPRRGLRELARVLRPGGRLYLTCPNYLNVMGLYRFYLPLRGRHFVEEDQPINHFLLAPLVRQWVKRAGLIVERAVGTGHYVLFPRHSPIRLRSLDRWRLLGRYFGLHSLIIARKPQAQAPGNRDRRDG